MRNVTVSSLRRQNAKAYRLAYYQPVPYIRLAGHWLAEAGIMPGQKLHVQVSGGALQITPAVHEGGAL